MATLMQRRRDRENNRAPQRTEYYLSSLLAKTDLNFNELFSSFTFVKLTNCTLGAVKLKISVSVSHCLLWVTCNCVSFYCQRNTISFQPEKREL